MLKTDIIISSTFDFYKQKVILFTQSPGICFICPCQSNDNKAHQQICLLSLTTNV